MGTCGNCERQFSIQRPWQKFCSKECRQAAQQERLSEKYICAYCGLGGSCIDEIPPLELQPMFSKLGMLEKYPITSIHCCSECKLALQYKPLWTFEQRKEYVKKWLKEHYKEYEEIDIQRVLALRLDY